MVNLYSATEALIISQKPVHERQLHEINASIKQAAYSGDTHAFYDKAMCQQTIVELTMEGYTVLDKYILSTQEMQEFGRARYKICWDVPIDFTEL